jgi:hypothetical protein
MPVVCPVPLCGSVSAGQSSSEGLVCRLARLLWFCLQGTVDLEFFPLLTLLNEATLPRLHWDWTQSLRHILAGTGLAPYHICTRTERPLPHAALTSGGYPAPLHAVSVRPMPT